MRQVNALPNFNYLRRSFFNPMEFIIDFFSKYILHLGDTLGDFVNVYQGWTYLVLFLVIFCETGLVVTPFLPGDSLLFVAGSIAAIGNLNILYLILLLFVAAVLGDTVNYFIGKYLGKQVFERNYRLINRKHLEKTQAFYEKHGGKTIIMARFVPIVRTFAPFVAGVGVMDYRKFIVNNIVGGALWVVGLTLAGFFLGTIPIVKDNFEIVIFAIIGISVLPIVIEFLRQGKKA